LKRGTKSARSTYGNLKRHISLISTNLRLWEINLDFVTALAENMMNNERTKSGEPLARATVTGTISSLSCVLRYAARKGMIQSNPVEQYDTRKIQGPVYKRVYLTADELKALVRTECSVESYKRLFLFACFVGLRYSDLITLRWSDVVEEKDEIRIEKMMHKTQHMVYVPLGKIARDYLPERGEPDALVFPDLPKGTSDIDAIIKQWVSDAGIEKKVTFYSSRHTFATLNLTQGADLYVVSQLLGHKEIRTTEGYAEIIDVKRTEAMYMIDKLFSEYLPKNNLNSKI
jgi:integrase